MRQDDILVKILQYCKEANKPLTARHIVEVCFPGKKQPYVNPHIDTLVQNKKLIRNDKVRPYTVRLPIPGEKIPKPEKYSNSRRLSNSSRSSVDGVTVTAITKEALEDAVRCVNDDPRYGAEARIISDCFNKFPKNDDDNVIAMKIALIDMTNSTNLNKHLSKVYLTKLIEKIRNNDFDKRVARGDITLISELARNEINLFSFFSKYCLYHNYYVYKRDDFVIFDGVMQNHAGKFISRYEYKGRVYGSSQIKNCIDKMRSTYDYEGYLKFIDTILENNNIQSSGRHRKFDWFVWYNNRKAPRNQYAVKRS